jgi:hypothetical protein
VFFRSAGSAVHAPGKCRAAIESFCSGTAATQSGVVLPVQEHGLIAAYQAHRLIKNAAQGYVHFRLGSFQSSA